METRRFGSKDIDPDHLLMGVLSFEEGPPLKARTELGIRFEDAPVLDTRSTWKNLLRANLVHMVFFMRKDQSSKS